MINSRWQKSRGVLLGGGRPPTPSSKPTLAAEALRVIDERRETLSVKDRFVDHWRREWSLLMIEWKFLALALFVCLYVHSSLTNMVYYLHTPGEPLKDLGYELLPELTGRWSSLGEDLTIAYAAVVTVFMCANFFVHQPPRAGTADGQIIFCIHMLVRVAACVTICILLRCITFMVTILPGPAPHCSPENHNPPTSMYEVVFRFDALTGCGDLIFSSHTLVAINFALCVNHYCTRRFVKVIMWTIAVLLSFAIIAARHHYTVDVVIAWYVVPLVWSNYLRWRPDLPFPSLPEDKYLINNVELESICIADDVRDVKSYRPKRTFAGVGTHKSGSTKTQLINGASRMFAGASKHFNSSVPFAGVSPRNSSKLDEKK